MGGYPPSLLWEASEGKNCPKRAFFPKIIAQKRCKYQCFCFFLLVAMGDASFEFVAFYGVLCMCFLKTLVIYSVFREVVQKHCKIQRFGPVVLPKRRK